MSGLEHQFLGLMAVTLTIEPRVGVDRFSQPSYGPPHTCQAWIAEMPRRTTDKTQDTVWQISQAVVDPSETVKMADRVTFPDGTQPPLLEIALAYDDKGLHHLELLFGYARKSTIF